MQFISSKSLKRLHINSLVIVALLFCGTALAERPWVYVTDQAAQPFVAATKRVQESLDYLGSSLNDKDNKALRALLEGEANEATLKAIQDILDPYCLASININPEARVKVVPGPAAATLMQGGWSTFLVRVENESGTRAVLEAESPNAEPSIHRSSGAPNPKEENLIPAGEFEKRFLELQFYTNRPMQPDLTGQVLEYRILQIYTNIVGSREAMLGFHVGQGTQDLGHRKAIHVQFDCQPSVKVVLKVEDFDGAPVMASFTIRDNIERIGEAGRQDYRFDKARSSVDQRPGLEGKPLRGIYPLPARRAADKDEYPDFFFQPQVYRQDGEHVFLPPGDYEVTWTRGPEYIPQTRSITVPESVKTHTETFKLKRWIHMAGMGWYSGDHHVHAGGCSHYEAPEAGVKPESMLRQAMGEDLNVSCILTWGPCWYYQKTFFEGDVSALSTKDNIIRYDVEVSGFPSGHAGHLSLLRLKEDDYPGTTKIEEWPSYTLPILQWTQNQGGVAGYSHSGWGLEPVSPTDELPNYVMAKFDGIGANEYIITVTHGAVDFISAGDTPVPWELNIWYHTLNCGYRVAISGETDFPCIFDERIGLARSYAELGETLSFDSFSEKIHDAAVYVSDGRSHIIDFQVNDASIGVGNHELNIDKPETVKVHAQVASYLPEEQDLGELKLSALGATGSPYWNVEKSRIEGTRQVPVEILVNGYVVETRIIEANGALNTIDVEVPIQQSSWVAMRVSYSAHTNPIYVLVDDKPVRSSKRSALWCRASVDRCWEMKQGSIRADDHASATVAYDHARKAYDDIIAASYDDLDAGGVGVHLVYQHALTVPEGGQVVTVESPDALRTDGWSKVGGKASSYEGFYYWCHKGEGRKRFIWDAPVEKKGNYEVLVWTPEKPGGIVSKEAPFTIYHSGGEDTVKVDQTTNIEAWTSLGTYSLDGMSKVELSDNSDGRVIAEAVVFVPKL